MHPPQRRRLIVQAQRERIAWPDPTHLPTEMPMEPGLKRWRQAREVIDWSVRGQKLSERVEPLTEKTMGRIRAGIHRFCNDSQRAFLLSYYGSGNNIHSIDLPLPTVTTKDRFALVQVIRGEIYYRMLLPREYAYAMGFTATYKIAGGHGDQVKQIGNAVPVNTAKALLLEVLQSIFNAGRKRVLPVKVLG